MFITDIDAIVLGLVNDYFQICNSELPGVSKSVYIHATLLSYKFEYRCYQHGADSNCSFVTENDNILADVVWYK